MTLDESVSDNEVWIEQFEEFCAFVESDHGEHHLDAIRNRFFQKFGERRAVEIAVSYAFLRNNWKALEEGYGGKFMVAGKDTLMLRKPVIAALWMVFRPLSYDDMEGVTVGRVLNALKEIE